MKKKGCVSIPLHDGEEGLKISDDDEESMLGKPSASSSPGRLMQCSRLIIDGMAGMAGMAWLLVIAAIAIPTKTLELFFGVLSFCKRSSPGWKRTLPDIFVWRRTLPDISGWKRTLSNIPVWKRTLPDISGWKRTLDWVSNREEDAGPPGLLNLGNTCYFNAVMQVLANTSIFQAELEKVEEKSEFMTRFVEFCKDMTSYRRGRESPDGERRRINPADILGQFSSRVERFRGYDQQDSHECLRHFLDELRKEEKAAAQSTVLTAVDKVFGGHLITVYVCQRCGKPHHLVERFLDISLPIIISGLPLGTDDDVVVGDGHGDDHQELAPDFHHSYVDAINSITTPLANKSVAATNTKLSIRDCLKFYTRREHLPDEYLCNRCQMEHQESGETGMFLTAATKRTLILDPPAILTIHLKRFELMPGRPMKRDDMVSYEELLDVAPYCSSWCMRNDPPSPNLWYSLFGVVVHSGSLQYGHYIAYVKVRDEVKDEVRDKDAEKFLQLKPFGRVETADQITEMMRLISKKRKQTKPLDWNADVQTGTWFCMNDSRVYKVSLGDALNQRAYLLFYERVGQEGEEFKISEIRNNVYHI